MDRRTKEQPSPPCEPKRPIQFKKSDSNEVPKRTTYLGAAEEESSTEGKFFLSVP